MARKRPLVGVVMGSDSDLPAMEKCLKQLDALGIAYEVRVISAHRTPQAADRYAAAARRRGLKVIIAAAGMSAALAGVLAGRTTLPVIGVPLARGPLAGTDAALSTLQMPPGVPVGCMSIGGAVNAAIFAAEILAASDKRLTARLKALKKTQKRSVADKDSAVRRRK
ncbi:MAG: 5-(carboxyamino)imidazole ribonucleotide mutase [Planctomycetota bacterium]